MNLTAATVFALVVLGYVECKRCSDNPVVCTSYGEVRGSYNASRHGRRFMSFRGIPYAQAPVGQLRFKEPQPIEAWTGQWDATKEGPVCIQTNYLFYQNPPVEGVEDCLYLNVYTPRTDGELPVMVFIHWGAFTAGRGTSDYIGPEYFMDQDVVLVTFNYRLGAFGFLSTLDDEAPGNYALKDQVAALKWVQANIANFGGNKDKVTIFGQSAGAGSVHYHLLSPLSKGLFHHAISESGSALSLWAKPLNALQPTVVQATAALVGCQSSIGNSTQLVECLRNVPAETLAKSFGAFKFLGMDSVSVFSSVTEKQTERNPNPFFTKEPLEYILAGEFQNVPWILGTVEDEGIIRVASLVRQPKQLEAFNANFTSLLPQMLVLSVSTTDVEGELKNITDHYLNGQPFLDVNDPNSIQGMIDLYTGRSFSYGSYQSAMLHSAMGHNPVWFYNFRYRGEYSYGDLFAGTDNNVDFHWGVSHCDELLYLFKSSLFPDLIDPTSNAMVDVMIQLWTNFAKTGKPVDSTVLDWQPLNVKSLEEMKNENFNYMVIAGSPENKTITMDMETGFENEMMKFWISQELFENIPGID